MTTEQPVEKPGWPDPPRAIALTVLAVISGFIVWSFHNFDWFAFIASLLTCAFLGIMTGAFVGVSLFSSLGTMACFGGLGEGAIQGWIHFGWVGAILGGLIGIVGGSIIGMLPLMLTHFALVVCGIDPFANLDLLGEKKGESK
jgi:hypothetical protein